MPSGPSNQKPVNGLEAFELASLRNSPLSVITPGELGRAPMARGRFLLPESGTVLVENLQIPGRRVDLRTGQAIECYFQHEGLVYQFRSRVIEMDTPVRLNDTLVVRGMRIVAPASIERGNRRSIYRQSFAIVQPPVDVDVWAVPLGLLTPDQLAACAAEDAPESPPLDATATTAPVRPGSTPAAGIADEIDGFRIERGERIAVGIPPAQTLYSAVRGLTLDQVRPVMKTAPHWKGEVADASEFGIGLVLHRLVYSRLKVFQPLVVRFTLPGQPGKPAGVTAREGADCASEFLLEIRRVQGAGDFNARVGGTLLINALSAAEVRASRELARFTLDLQRERARRLREAG